MALASGGISMSYESEKLISEIQHDLEEFGNDLKVIAFYEKKDGVNVVVDYLWQEDMSDEEMELRELAPTEEEYMWKTDIENLLKYVKLQDDPLEIRLNVQNLIK